MDRYDKQLTSNDFADLKKQWKSDDAYAADAYRLVAANPNTCTKCHNIGKIHVLGAKGPDMDKAAERLRPEWMLKWISNPERMFAYSPAMPAYFPNNGTEVYILHCGGSDGPRPGRAGPDDELRPDRRAARQPRCRRGYYGR